MSSARRLPTALHLLLSAAALAAGCGAGCGQTVIYQPASGPVRLAEPVSARIYVRDQTGAWVKGTNRVTIPAGYYVLPPPTPSPAPATAPAH